MVELLVEVGHPLFLKKSFERNMLQRSFYERQGVEFQKLIGFGKVGAFRVKILFKGYYLLLGNYVLSLEGGMNRVNEEVDSDIEFEFRLFPEEKEYFQKLASFPLGESRKQFFLVPF